MSLLSIDTLPRMERLQTVLTAIQQGQVDEEIIDLAMDLLHEKVAPDY